MSCIALFGATGKTGRRVVHRALAAGHSVRALVRRPEALPSDARLVLLVGDVLDREAVDRTIAGADAVISVLGHVRGSPADLQTLAMRNIVEAAKARGVRRIISLTGGGVRADGDRPRVPDHLLRALLRVVSPAVLADAEHHVEVLRDSGLDWTVVRAPMLTEAPGGQSLRVGSVGVDTGIRLSRDDLARYLVAQVDDTAQVGRLPFVSS